MSDTSIQDLSSNPRIVEHIAHIKGLHGLFETATSQLRETLNRFELRYPDEQMLARPDYWQVVVAHDSAIRLRLIIEGNLSHIETLALLATVRYIFELLVWLKLAVTREEYALAYYGRLLEKSKEHAASQLKQLSAEIELLEKLETLDQDVVGEAARGILHLDAQGGDLRDAIRSAMSDVDRRAARMFSLYADKGKTLGFGYTAHLVKTQAIPRAAATLTAIETQLKEFIDACPVRAKELITRKWKWDREARGAGMESAFAYLYSYVSRLLHATPASITTDEKHLTPAEIEMFLGFIRTSLLDALDLVGGLGRTRPTAAASGA